MYYKTAGTREKAEELVAKRVAFRKKFYPGKRMPKYSVRPVKRELVGDYFMNGMCREILSTPCKEAEANAFEVHED